MNVEFSPRGGAPVGYIGELGAVEAGAVYCLRAWLEGADSQASVWNDFATNLGPGPGRRAIRSFEQICDICVQYGRRPLMRHSVDCKCLGADESCFANLIACATEGARDDAMLIATLLVRADMAASLVCAAGDFGIALKRLALQEMRQLVQPECPGENSTIH